MTDTIEMSGGCQCGAVRYHAAIQPETAHICHCRMCQKAVGNAFAALVSATNETVIWTRGEPAVFMSSDPISRGFCAKCGTPLFYRSLKGRHTSFTIGSLDRPDLVRPQTQEGIEGRIAWISDLHEVRDAGTTEGQMPELAAQIQATNHQHPDHDTTTWPPSE